MNITRPLFIHNTKLEVLNQFVEYATVFIINPMISPF